MIGTSCSGPKEPMRVKCIHKWRWACSWSTLASALACSGALMDAIRLLRSLASPYNATRLRWARQAELCEIRLVRLVQAVQGETRLFGLSPLATFRRASYA